MNNLQEFYRKIEYLRSNGVKMKEIADWIDMAPSILSSLYTTVLPNYFEGIKSYPPEEALDSALALVNNVSKKTFAFPYRGDDPSPRPDGVRRTG